MSVFRFFYVLMLLLVTASQFFVSMTIAEVGEAEDATALADAERAVVSAYQTVLKAEDAGANVSSLLVRLNEGCGFLAQARMAYRLGDFAQAAGFAALSKSIGDEVQNEAVELEDAALSEGVQRMMLTMTASVLSIALVALGSSWLWHSLKKRYGQATVS